jgi:hypothetical protein
MIPIKLQCGCGQKYAFEVEPANNQMPSAIVCPVCGTDGTAAANQVIAQTLAASPPPVAARVRMAAVPPQIEAPPVPAARVPIAVKPTAKPSAGEFNLGLGILGAFLGALAGAGAMFAFYRWAGFRFPLLGVGIGVLTGFGAKLLYRGTSNALGVASGSIALVAVVGTLYLMYGVFPIVSIISVAVSVSFAYRISSG